MLYLHVLALAIRNTVQTYSMLKHQHITKSYLRFVLFRSFDVRFYDIIVNSLVILFRSALSLLCLRLPVAPRLSSFSLAKRNE